MVARAGMIREYQVRFREGLGVQLPRPTRRKPDVMRTSLNRRNSNVRSSTNHHIIFRIPERRKSLLRRHDEIGF